MDDKTLIEKCLARDLAAWDEFTGRYYSLVLRSVKFKLKRLGAYPERDLASDITQDIFLMLWESDKLSLIRDVSSLKGWLAVVSINHTSTYVKKKDFSENQRAASLDAPIPGTDNITLGSLLPGTLTPRGDSSNGANAESNELIEMVSREISKLVPKQALALKFRVLNGLSEKEISVLLKVPESTVSTLIKRGRVRLRKRLSLLINQYL